MNKRGKQKQWNNRRNSTRERTSRVREKNRIEGQEDKKNTIAGIRRRNLSKE